MIQDFFNVIQRDFTHIGQFFQTKNPSEDQKRRVGLAAMRMFAVLGIALSAVIGFGAFTAATAIGALFKLAFAVTLYVVCHDVFVITKNLEKGILAEALLSGIGILEDIGDLLSGDKDLDDPMRHPFSDGTLLRPFWDGVFAQAEV